jgi:hypothetical protein
VAVLRRPPETASRDALRAYVIVGLPDLLGHSIPAIDGYEMTKALRGGVIGGQFVERAI